MPSQPVLLAVSCVALFVIACSLVFITIRLSRIVSALLDALSTIRTVLPYRPVEEKGPGEAPFPH